MSGFRICTKHEAIKVSTSRSSLNVRMRYALTARDSLLMTTIFSLCRTLSWATRSSIFGNGFDWANMKSRNWFRVNGRFS